MKTCLILFLSIINLTGFSQIKEEIPIISKNKTDVAQYKPVYDSTWRTIDSKISKSWITSLVQPSKKLPFPFLSIAPGRTIIFYWDTYFTNVGLFYHPDVQQYSLNSTNNLLYEVESYGYVPNSSESWGLNRSQPPYLSMMVRDVYEKSQNKDKKWLTNAYYTLRKEYNFWINDSIEKNSTSITGLQRYYNHATDSELIQMYQIACVKRFGYPENVPDSQKISIAIPYTSEAESGMDFTPRFEDRCHQFVALDLNCNLYLYEINFSWMVEELSLKNEPNWNDIAQKRKELINKYCWNSERGIFMDYDFVNNRHSKVAAATSFSPLFVGLATTEQANLTLKNLNLFEQDWGIAVCEQTHQNKHYQWDFPAGWPPLQFLVIKGLDNYGFKKEAQRIASKYCDLVAKNFINPQPLYFTKRDGTKEKRSLYKVYEKYEVSNGFINDAEYPSRPFMGWTAGVFVYSYHYILNNNNQK